MGDVGHMVDKHSRVLIYVSIFLVLQIGLKILSFTITNSYIKRLEAIRVHEMIKESQHMGYTDVEKEEMVMWAKKTMTGITFINWTIERDSYNPDDMSYTVYLHTLDGILGAKAIFTDPVFINNKLVNYHFDYFYLAGDKYCSPSEWDAMEFYWDYKEALNLQ